MSAATGGSSLLPPPRSVLTNNREGIYRVERHTRECFETGLTKGTNETSDNWNRERAGSRKVGDKDGDDGTREKEGEMIAA